MKWIVALGALCAACSDGALRFPESKPPPPPPNLCSGTTVLEHKPGERCGDCDYWICSSSESVTCDHSARNRCGACGPVPAEECNGRDDNCDGEIDEGCVDRLSTQASFVAQLRSSTPYALFIIESGYDGEYQVGVADRSKDDFHVIDSSALRGTSLGTYNANAVSVDEDIGAWDLYRSGTSGTTNKYQLAIRRLSTNEDLTPTLQSVAGTPVVNRGRVLYQESASLRDPANLVLFDTNSRIKRSLPVNPPQAYDLDGDWVAIGSRDEIKLLQLSTGQERLVAGHSESYRPTSIDLEAPFLTWTEAGAKSGEWNLFVYNMETGVTSLVTTGASRVAADGELACWTVPIQSIYPDQPGAISVYHFRTGRQLQITSFGASCDITENTVTWVDRQVYQARIRRLTRAELRYLDGET